jgi:hypothetical protein
MLDGISAILALIGTYLVTYSIDPKKNIWGMIFWIASCVLAIIYFLLFNVSVVFAILNFIYIIFSIHGIWIRRR